MLDQEVYAFSELIKTTEVKQDWEKIADAWDKRMLEISSPDSSSLRFFSIRQSLMKQMAIAQASDRSQLEVEAGRPGGAEGIRQRAIDNLL